MRSIGLLAIIFGMGTASVAGAQCAGWDHRMDASSSTTAESTYTPIPDAAPSEVAESPLLLLPLEEDTETSEG